MSERSTHSPDGASPVQIVPRWRKYARRAMLAAAGLLVLLAAAFFLLPIWISNEQGRLYALDRFNDRLHGPRVAVDEWTVGWFRATELKNLRILAPDGSTILSCPRVSSGLTLWDLVWSNYDLRNTVADQLELRIAKNVDGTTSLDSFAGAAEILRSARGALQVTNGQVAIYSARTGQTLRYSNAKATIRIASAEAPFDAQITALGAGETTFALTGTFPPTRSLSEKHLLAPGIWSLLTNVDLAATHVPTGLACDFLHIDGAWAASFGDLLDTIQLAAHPPEPAASTYQDMTRLTLLVRGGAQLADPAVIDAHLLLRPPSGEGTGGNLLATPSLGANSSYVNAALRPSAPLTKLLARLNPLLGEIAPPPTPASGVSAGAGAPGGLIHGSTTTLALPLDHPENAEASLRLTFPALEFAAHDGPSLLRQLQVTFGETPRAKARIAGTADTLRATLAGGEFHYENFLFSIEGRRVNFSGNVALDGKLELTAQIPDSNPGLAASATQVLITGTTDAPLLKRAE